MTTAVTGTIPDAPVFPTTETLTANVTPTIGTDWTLMKSVNIYLDGEATKKDGTKKLIQDWLKTNKKTISEANQFDITRVSSYALVVDVAWDAAFAPVRGTGTDSSATTFQPLGTTGDAIAVMINTERGSYT